MVKRYSPEWWLGLRPEVAGKETERIVEAILKEAGGDLKFASHRMPDAKAARGALAAQPADYLVAYNTNVSWLEVKALKHEYRLPRDRLSQLPVLNKFSLAGMDANILIHHYTTQSWRLIPITFFEFGVPSWDLREWKTYTSAEAALRANGVTP